MPKNASVLIDIGKGLSLMVGLPRIPQWNSKERPKKPKRGTFGFYIKTNSLEYWDGSAWYGATMDTA